MYMYQVRAFVHALNWPKFWIIRNSACKMKTVIKSTDYFFSIFLRKTECDS